MRKVLLIMGIMFLLTGCTKAVKTDYKLVSFEYGESGSAFDSIYSYLVKKEGDEWRFTLNRPASKFGDLECDVDIETIENLEKVLKDNEIGKWNGFDKANKNVLDGNSFHLSVTFTDANVSASGYHSYPKNYSEFVKGVKELLDPYIVRMEEEAREKYLSAPFDSDIDSMLVAFTNKNYPKDHEISFHFYHNDDGSIHFYGDIDLKIDDFLPVGKYHLNKDVPADSIDLDRIKEAFLNSGIIAQDDKMPEGEDEWYQISIEFGDGRRVDTMGSESFENYTEFRMIVLEELSKVVSEAE